jgi:Uma2 family endonuclease
MATALLLKPARVREPIGADCAGIRMTDDEFDEGEFDDEWDYELINGVLVVAPIAGAGEVDPNEELGFQLRAYRKYHPQGKALEKTLPERNVFWPKNRRKADRVIWAGLGRRPKEKQDLPTIVIEFVSRGRRHWLRDYHEKRDEYTALGIQEYWVINRFDHTMTVFTMSRGKQKQRLVRPSQTYRTPLLPGFELRLAELFQLSDEWED